MAGREEDALRRKEGGVVLRLELEPGEPLAGFVAVEGQPEKRFCGWIELMAMVNAVRVRSGGDVESD